MTTIDTYGMADYVARVHRWTVRGHKMTTSLDVSPGMADRGIYAEWAGEVASTDGTRECRASWEVMWHLTTWADGTCDPDFGHRFVETFDFLDDETRQIPLTSPTLAAALREAAAAIDSELSRLTAKRDALAPPEA